METYYHKNPTKTTAKKAFINSLPVMAGYICLGIGFGVLLESNALPCAIMGMLVVYCLKDVTFFSGNHGIPEVICVILVVILHKWKHNSLLSIFVGTVVYMLLVQMVF